MDLSPTLARELGLPVQAVAKTVALFDGGDTIPFLARYRKEQTGGLDEVQLRALQDALGRARKLEIHDLARQAGRFEAHRSLPPVISRYQPGWW